MKIFFVLLLVCTSIFSLAGCGNASNKKVEVKEVTEKAVLESIIRLGGKVKRDKGGLEVDFIGPQFNDDLLVSMRNLKDLKVLSVTLSSITDRGMESLKQHRQLQELYLDGFPGKRVRIGDAGLAHLKGIKDLRKLGLSEADVTDRGLSYLKDLKELESLNLRGTQITDDGLAFLEGFKKLEQLSIGWTQITDAGLVHIKNLVKLKNFSADSTRVTDKGLDNLKNLADLEYLSFADTQITNDGVNYFAKLKRLRELNLGNTQVTKKALVHLKDLTDLQELTIGKTIRTEQYVDADLQYFKNMIGLRKLNLEDARITDFGLENLQRLHKLEQLSLSNTSVGDKGILFLKGFDGIEGPEPVQNASHRRRALKPQKNEQASILMAF
jgi:Leucine-rich repeat (LRR) protein